MTISRIFVWGVLLFFLSYGFLAYKLWFATVALVVISAPVAVVNFYFATVSRIRRLNIYNPGGWVYKLFSGRFLIFLIGTISALFFSFFMLLQFQVLSAWEWVVLTLMVPVFYVVYNIYRMLILSQFKSYILTKSALRGACFISPIIMIFIYALIYVFFTETPAYHSYEEIRGTYQSAIGKTAGSSALLEELSRWIVWYEGIKVYALGQTQFLNKWWQMLFILGLGYATFFNAARMLSFFLIPTQELKRIINPITDEEVPSAPSNNRIMITMIIVVVLVITFYLPMVAGLESRIRNNPEFAEIRQTVQREADQHILQVEQIGDKFVRKGTIRKLNSLKIELLQRSEISLARVEKEADLAFDSLEVNVDAFLDWYYSLPAEYARIYRLMIGDIEIYLAEKILEHLQQGNAFQKLEFTLNQVISENQIILQAYQEEVNAIIAENQVQAEREPFRVLQAITLAEALTPPAFDDSILFGQRVLYSSGGGVVLGTLTGVITHKIAAKVIAKQTLQVAAKALAKVAASKAAASAGSAAVGALIGGAIGSVFPFFGTAAGAALGGTIVGVATAVSLDKLFLMLEEYMSREKFKAELMDAIEEARLEFKESLRSGQLK